MRLEDSTIRGFLDALAAKTPTPGGGAVAALLAALAAALAQMVLNYSIGKKSLSPHEDSNRAALSDLARHAKDALALAEADAAAYGRLNELLRLNEADARRLREMPAAVDAAIDAPKRVMQSALEMLGLMKQLRSTTNAMLKSDLAIAAVAAAAAVRAAAWNVRINLPLMKDSSAAAALELLIESSVTGSATLCDEIERGCE